MTDFIPNVGPDQVSLSSRFSGSDPIVNSQKYRAARTQSRAVNRSVHEAGASSRVRAESADTAGRAEGRGVDRVELSHEARMMSVLSEADPVRHDVVERVRMEIASGGYETREKWDIAVGRLIDDALEEL